MKVVELVEGLSVVGLPDVCDFGCVLKWYLVGFGVDVDFIAEVGFDHFGFLVCPCRIEDELGVFDIERAGASGFEDTAFAE